MQILRLHIPHNAEHACKLNVLAQPSTLRAATTPRGAVTPRASATTATAATPAATKGSAASATVASSAAPGSPAAGSPAAFAAGQADLARLLEAAVFAPEQPAVLLRHLRQAPGWSQRWSPKPWIGRRFLRGSIGAREARRIRRSGARPTRLHHSAAPVGVRSASFSLALLSAPWRIGYALRGMSPYSSGATGSTSGAAAHRVATQSSSPALCPCAWLRPGSSVAGWTRTRPSARATSASH